MLSDGKVNHRLAYGRIPDGLRCPGTTNLTELLGEQFIYTCLVVGPVYQVVAGHQHQSAVVTPAKLVGAFPLGGAQSHLLTEHMQVGHGNVEFAVGSTVDMRVAYASLVGDRVAGNNGLAIVYSRKRVAIVADGHKQRVGWIVEIRKQIGTHILFGERFLGFGIGLSHKGQQ